ncbi:hypothetical protein [Sulfuricurvum sp.]|uniref:hypothetical protein n=1 Tax=Sulfuricurvum sp. TaxID=2025608 RepID=UPI002D46E326|nr:hypothetical protein [Sulfuricurvum sp.]HZF69891.1 hypothetical protein [Sulfuricurvum sp.]
MGETHNKSNIAFGATNEENVGFSKADAVVTYNFYNFTRDEIKVDLEEKKNAPWKIAQAQTSLCGMAVVAYFYAKLKYDEYRQFVLDLHAYGTATSKAGYTLKTDPDKHLQQLKKDETGGMSPDDFILLASLRDQENGLFDYLPAQDRNTVSVNMEGLKGFSLPHEVAKLMKDLVGLDVIDKTNLAFSVPTDNTVIEYIKTIQSALAKGHSIAMLINADIFEDSKPFFTTPNHWIGIIELQVINTLVRITCFSWGRIRKYDIKIDLLIDGCFGYIIGKGR